jgi:hypothetical protein
MRGHLRREGSSPDERSLHNEQLVVLKGLWCEE